ncbi:hypothetical protein FQR65_LT09861 [Abscondita terminalis]|nr:hypothetical protein FQR65_LT09861 [Abscondita terminalis]
MFSSKLCALLSVIVHLAVSQNLPPQAVEEWNNIISPYVSECMPQQETAKEDVEAIIKKAHLPPEAVEDWNKVIAPFKNECIPKQHADKDDVEAITKKAHAKDSSIVCEFLQCVYKKLNLFDQNGEIMEDAVTNAFVSLPSNITKKCIGESTTQIGGCRKSYVFGNCVIRERVSTQN